LRHSAVGPTNNLLLRLLSDVGLLGTSSHTEHTLPYNTAAVYVATVREFSDVIAPSILNVCCIGVMHSAFVACLELKCRNTAPSCKNYRNDVSPHLTLQNLIETAIGLLLRTIGLLCKSLVLLTPRVKICRKIHKTCMLKSL